MGWVYLAVVLDLFSRKVVGWSVSASPYTALILPGTQPGRNPAAGRARQWPAVPFRPRLPIHQPRLPGQTGGIGHPSQHLCPVGMSRRGNCWEGLPLGYNAVMERFFRSLKVEAISRDRYQTQDEMVWAVKKYIHFYNTKRLHSTIGSVSPNQYEQVFLK
jgi:transposase InsO family protein